MRLNTLLWSVKLKNLSRYFVCKIEDIVTVIDESSRICGSIMGYIFTTFGWKFSFRCFFFGDTSSKRDPTTYLTYIFALYDHYRKEYCMFNKNERTNAGMPLVINTPGWVKGMTMLLSLYPLFLLIDTNYVLGWSLALLDGSKVCVCCYHCSFYFYSFIQIMSWFDITFCFDGVSFIYSSLGCLNVTFWFLAGIGYDILVDMLKYISPTHVVKICISAESKNLPLGAFWLDEEDSTSTTIIEVNSALQDYFKRSYVFW